MSYTDTEWKELNRKARHYIAIAKHGEDMDSNVSWIRDEQRRAVLDNAPLNAVYRNHEGHWVTTDDYPVNHQLRVWYEKSK